MKVLLFEIGGPREEYNEPLGIELIATNLISEFTKEKIPIQVDVKWYFETEKLPSKDEMAQYDVIGFSLQIGSFERFSKVYDDYCKLPKQPVIVVGNVIPTFAGHETLSQFNNVIAIRGEGEVAFHRLCKIMIEHGNVSANLIDDITNISYYNEKREIFDAPSVPIDVNTLPHAERRFCEVIRNKGGIARIEGSRGCHWGKCNFCCVKEKYGTNRWRPFPIDYIVSELEILGKNNILSPYFTDEDFFGGDYDRGMRLANAIMEAKENGRIPPNMNYFLSVMANDVKNPKGFMALLKLKEAGLREVFIGIEAFSKNQLKRFGKKANINANKIALEKMLEVGFQIDIGYIIFDPFMKFKELEENIKYLDELALNTYDSRSLKKLRIQPKTPIENTYSSVITGSLDFDNLLYPYKFQDPKVQISVDMYEEWEEPFKQPTYLLQADSRGEVKNEKLRLDLKVLLGKIRDIDFSAIKIIVSNLSNNNNLESIKEKLELLYSKKRKLIPIKYLNK